MMNDYLTVLALALLPFFGNFFGGLLVEVRPPTRKVLNLALHAAAGIILAVVAVELVPTALQGISGWTIGIAFGLGGAAYLAIQTVVSRIQARRGGDDRTSMWMIYIAVATDLMTDGLLIGAGSSLSFSLGLILAVGQVMADLPEGYAVIGNARENGLPRSRRLLLGLSFIVPVLLAATLAFFLLQGQGDAPKLTVLMFAAGLLMVAGVEDMLSEAHESQEDVGASILSLVGGFVLFTFVSTGL